MKWHVFTTVRCSSLCPYDTIYTTVYLLYIYSS